MELSPSLRLHLDALAPYLDDKAVTEVLVAAPDRVLVARGSGLRPVEIELPENRIRALADRLVRTLGLKSRPERPEVQSVELADLFIIVVGAVRGPRCPLIRVLRRTAVLDSLDQLEARGEIDPAGRQALEVAARDRKSILVTGPRGARTTDFVAALARTWQTHGRVALLEDGQAVLAALGVATFEVDGGAVAHALSLGADVLVAEEPTPLAWARLLETGRPFVVSVEASDGAAAVQRVVGLGLAGAPQLSRSAAEALVLASLGTIVELSATANVPALKTLFRAVWIDGALGVEPLTPSGRPQEVSRTPKKATLPSRPPEPRAGTPTLDAPQPKVQPKPDPRRIASRPVLRPRPASSPPGTVPLSRESAVSQAVGQAIEDLGRGLSSSVAARFDDPELSDILPESLLSHSFVGRFQASAGDETRRASAPNDPPTLDPISLPQASTLDGGLDDAPAPTPDLVPDNAEEVGFSDEETDGTKEMMKKGSGLPAAGGAGREAVERLPTVSLPPPSVRPRLGVGHEAWAARELKGLSEPVSHDADTGLGLPAQNPIVPDSFDPSEATFQLGEVESVRTGAFDPRDVSAEDVVDNRDPDATDEGSADWDPDAPSEVIEPSDRKRLIDPLESGDRRRRLR